MDFSLHSRITVTRMVNIIAKEICKRPILRMIQSNSKFTKTVDKPITLSAERALVVYILSYFDAKTPVVAFLDLCELDGPNAETIKKLLLWSSLKCTGISSPFTLNNKMLTFYI